MRAAAIVVACFAAVAGCRAGWADDSTMAALETIIVPGPATPYAEEQILVTIRGTYDGRVVLEEMTTERIPSFDWVQLETDRWDREIVDGREVTTFERHLAVFAKRPGTLTVPPFTHHLTIVPIGGQRTDVTVSSAPVGVEVAPPPATDPDTWWLPAKSVTVTDEWSKNPSTLVDGESVRRTITLTAEGVLPQRLPPQPNVREPWLITFADPEERSVEITPDGPVSTVVWSWRQRPITGEPGTVAHVAFAWFDTEDRAERTIALQRPRIGYAGFADSGSRVWHRDFPIKAPVVLVVCAAFVLTLGAVFTVVQFKGREELIAVIRRAQTRSDESDGDLAVVIGQLRPPAAVLKADR